MVFLTIQTDFRYIILFSSIENLVFDVKFQSFLVKTVFLTIQPDFRYIILFSSIGNLVFDVKFQYFLVKTVFFNYTNGFSIYNAIFFYIKPRFKFKISVFPFINGVF